MAWISFLESAELPRHSTSGSDQSHIANKIDSASRSSCLECIEETCQKHQSLMTSEILAQDNYPISILYQEDSRARTSVLREMELAWEEADRSYFSKSFDSPATYDPDSFSWRMSQQSLFEGLTEFCWSSLRWGTIVDGRLYQPQRWAPVIFENDGFYLPTPTAWNYGKNQGRKKDNTPSGRPRYSLPYRARRGEVPGHPMGLLNPEWVEQAMGYPIGWTDIEPWATQWCHKRRGRRS